MFISTVVTVDGCHRHVPHSINGHLDIFLACRTPQMRRQDGTDYKCDALITIFNSALRYVDASDA